MTVLEWLAMASGIIMSLASVPQVMKIFKRKSAKDISAITYSIIFVGGIVWVLYGLEFQSNPLIVANSIGCTVVAFVIIGWFLYGR
jgi:MtN3 and saliva related transmembrane protein